MTVIPICQDVLDRVNKLGLEDGQPDDIQIGDAQGQITILDFLTDGGDDDSNASDKSFKHDKSYQKEFDDQLKEEARLMKTLSGNEPSPSQDKTQGDYISHEQQQDHFYKKPGNRDDANEDNEQYNKMDYQHGATHEDNDEYNVDESIALTGSANNGDMESIGDNAEVPKNLRSGLDGSYWATTPISAFLDGTSDSYWAVNMDNFYWGDGNDKMKTTKGNMLDAVSDYVQTEPSWVMATAYKMDEASSNQSHASNTTPQYGFHRSIKEFGNDGREATKHELYENLLGMDAVTMVNPKELNKDLCLNALTYLMFLKQKRTGKVKARGCADGRPQREYIEREEASPPIVLIYALFASCAINAIEKREVVTCDIPRAFLQSDWPEDKPTYLKFDRIMVDMLVEIDPSLKQHVITTRQGYKLMYGKLNKAVYGTLLGSILFYEKLATQLLEWDFTMNPYDACTWNKMVNGKQLMIQYFIDNLHISCVDRKAIDNLLHNLNDKFKTKFKELTVCKGKVHDHLGINIDYSNNRYVKFTMYNFIKDVLKEAREDMNGTFLWPADGKLFSVDPQSPRLNTMDADYFHRITAQLLFACKQARPDIQVAVAFLCTRVKAPTKEDYKKLTWVIRYLQSTIHLPLLIGWDETGVLMWSVDAAFAVHKDMRSHTGAALTMGKGALLSMSLKQKINTKSSTEAELVGVC